MFLRSPGPFRWVRAEAGAWGARKKPVVGSGVRGTLRLDHEMPNFPHGCRMLPNADCSQSLDVLGCPCGRSAAHARRAVDRPPLDGAGPVTAKPADSRLKIRRTARLMGVYRLTDRARSTMSNIESF